METLTQTLPAIDRQTLIHQAYDAQGYRGGDYLVVNDRYRALEKLTDAQLIAIINKNNG